MKSSLLFAAFVGSFMQVASAGAAEVGGRYTVAGTNFDGSKYVGTAEIVVSSNTTCHIDWHIGGSQWKGICMRADDTLVAAYKYKSTVGLVYYRILGSGVLDGIWTIADEDGAGTDVLTPQQ